MAKTVNLIRNTNAKLVSADIDKFGKTFAIQSPWNADGFSSVNVTVEQAPSDIKQYLEGDTSITVYPVPSNVDKLCEYALASFSNIEDLYLFKTSAIVVLEDDLSYLLDLNKIYVPSDLLSAYQNAYPTLSSKFDIIVEDYTLTIPFVGDTTLTTEYVDSVIAMLSNAEKNTITKVVIPTDFTQESADTIAWGYDFSALVNLDNNIWYGATQYDFSVFTINGSGTLTNAIVNNAINNISSNKLTLIEKVIVPVDFTAYDSGTMTAIQNAFSNLRYLETTYEAGTMEIDFQNAMWQEILTKITSLNKTLDEALVIARECSYTNTYDSQIIIIPPMIWGTLRIQNYPNLVWLYKTKLQYWYNINFYHCYNLLGFTECDVLSVTSLENAFRESLPTCYFDFNFVNGTPSGIQRLDSSYTGLPQTKKIRLFNYTLSLKWHAIMDREVIVELINSLGIPSTQQTLDIGATNLAKLTAEDIAIATQKNWLIQ